MTPVGISYENSRNRDFSYHWNSMDAQNIYRETNTHLVLPRFSTTNGGTTVYLLGSRDIAYII